MGGRWLARFADNFSFIHGLFLKSSAAIHEFGFMEGGVLPRLRRGRKRTGVRVKGENRLRLCDNAPAAREFGFMEGGCFTAPVARAKTH